MPVELAGSLLLRELEMRSTERCDPFELTAETLRLRCSRRLLASVLVMLIVILDLVALGDKPLAVSQRFSMLGSLRLEDPSCIQVLGTKLNEKDKVSGAGNRCGLPSIP